MSVVGRVGSALKRGVLYVPRRIASQYRYAAMGMGLRSLPAIKTGARIVDEQVGPFVSTIEGRSWPSHDQMLFGFGRIEDEKVGPFVLTAAKSWPQGDQVAFFRKGTVQKVRWAKWCAEILNTASWYADQLYSLVSLPGRLIVNGIERLLRLRP